MPQDAGELRITDNGGSPTRSSPMAHLFVEQLTVLDCSYLCAERGLVGESWIVDLELIGELDHQGMVLDFGAVKRQVRDAVESIADHRLLVPAHSPQLEIRRQDDCLDLRFDSAAGRISHRSPTQAVTLLSCERIEAGPLRQALIDAAALAVPDNVQGIEIQLRHEVIDGAWYRYSHGLKQHQGLCQRIAHGHRSRIEIHLDGERQPQLEQQWAERWQDIDLAHREDCCVQDEAFSEFRYTAAEGAFYLRLPTARCELLVTDTTVEQIAEHLAHEIAAAHPGQSVEVRAYEGVRKGAIARA